jgi:hypothetical protein
MVIWMYNVALTVRRAMLRNMRRAENLDIGERYEEMETSSA